MPPDLIMKKKTQQEQSQYNAVAEEVKSSFSEVRQDAVIQSEEQLTGAQQEVYEQYLAEAETQQEVEIHRVAEGSPVQEQLPAESTSKNIFSRWKNRKKLTQRAKERFQSPNADYMTYTMITRMEKETAGKAEVMEKLTENLNKKRAYVPNGVNRLYLFMFQGYERNAQGEPANEEEARKKAADLKVAQDYGSGELARRKPILDKLLEEVLNCKFSEKMLEKSYLEKNSLKVAREVSLLGEFEEQIMGDPINKAYFDELPERVKERISQQKEHHTYFSLLYGETLRKYNIKQNEYAFKDYTAEEPNYVELEIKDKKGNVKATKEVTEYEFHLARYREFCKNNSRQLKEVKKGMRLQKEREEIRQMKNSQAVETFKDNETDFITLKVQTEMGERMSETKDAANELVQRMSQTGHTGDYSRFGILLFQGYKKNEKGEPLNPYEAEKKLADEKVMEAFLTYKAEDRIPYINEYVERVLNIQLDAKNFEENNFNENCVEMIKDMLFVINYQNFLLDDTVNYSYFKTLPESIKQRFEDLNAVLYNYLNIMNGVLEEHKISMTQGENGAYSYRRDNQPYDEGEYELEDQVLTSTVWKKNLENFLKESPDLVKRLKQPLILEDEIKKNANKA